MELIPSTVTIAVRTSSVAYPRCCYSHTYSDTAYLGRVSAAPDGAVRGSSSGHTSSAGSGDDSLRRNVVLLHRCGDL